MGARGLMQVRPIVAHALASELLGKESGTNEALEPYFARFGPEQLDLEDPVLNIKLGISYLYLLKKSFRDLTLALTAYNRGPTEVKNRLEEDEAVPLDYANRVFSAYHGYRKTHRQN
jgi:soluble lytic murein transglycosylase-like protein